MKGVGHRRIIEGCLSRPEGNPIKRALYNLDLSCWW